jgi:non-heme chloroperoxidase
LQLEIISREAGKNARPRPPLLFVHGGYCDAWCWDRFFLPHLSRRGYSSHALSLRGHGGSDGHCELALAGLDAFAEDVLAAAATLPAPPVLIGHSMGAVVVERALAQLAAPAAVFVAPIPPWGLLPVATRLIGADPSFLWHIGTLDGRRTPLESLSALKALYFTDEVDPQVLAELVPHLHQESPRAVFELSLPQSMKARSRAPEMMVLGAERDALFPPAQVSASAARFGLEAEILPGLPHMFMLEPGWRRAADRLADWLDERFES